MKPRGCFTDDKDESRGCQLRAMLKNESRAGGFAQSQCFTTPQLHEVVSRELNLTYSVLFLHESCVESGTGSVNPGLGAQPWAGPGMQQPRLEVRLPGPLCACKNHT